MRVFPGCDHRISDYGEAWQEAIAVDWYFKEYDDLMAAVDFMCERDFVDSERLGVTGEMKKGEACELPLCL